jgi:hypothetical protein
MAKKIEKKKYEKDGKEERIQICPVCSSADIENDFSNPAAVATGFMNLKKCNNCGNKGTFFPTIPISQLKKPRRKEEVIVKEEAFNESFVKGIIGFWKITGILLIIFGILFLFVPSLFFISIIPILLGVIVTIYGFLYNKYKEKLFMKLLMILIVLIFVFGGLVVLLN